MKQPQGFTLIELLVSISIFTVITSVAVYNHAQFSGTVLLTNLTYEIALSVRQAQFYGITVKQSSAGNSFDSGYGIHFDTATPSSYILFEDKTVPNHIYAVGEATETFNIQKGNKVTKICLDGVCSFTSVDISFIRPNPDAYIWASGVNHGKAEVCVTSPKGISRKVVVESTGQISVSTAGCS